MSFFLHCCFTSTEARWLIRDGDRVGRGRQSEGSAAETVRKRPERPWNGSVKAVPPRHCPATCALRNCCFNCCTGQSHKDNVRCTAVDEQLGQLEANEVHCSAQLHLPTHDLFWANLRVQLHLPLRSLDLLISPGTLTPVSELNALKEVLHRHFTSPARPTRLP